MATALCPQGLSPPGGTGTRRCHHEHTCVHGVRFWGPGHSLELPQEVSPRLLGGTATPFQACWGRRDVAGRSPALRIPLGTGEGLTVPGAAITPGPL